MSKKFKKLLCGVLALAMLASSGIAALADEPVADATAETAVTETVADTEATDETEATADAETEADAEAEAEATEEVVEATEAPTPEPTAVPDPYAVDAYYQKALGLCSALGIITGYDDGSVKPESTVTRSEMAAIILRMTAMSSLSTYRNLYTDVTTAHWAADTIQTASDEGVINGMGDGTFNPDGEVLYEQALKMIVCGMNYDNEAQMKGGYPEGYLAVAANNLSLLEGVKGSRGVATPRGEIIKMVYNALIGPYNDLKTYENGNPVYDSTETLAKAKFDVIEAKGLLTGTSTTSIFGAEPAVGQITIDGEAFLCDLTDLEGLIANQVTYYYVNDGLADEKVIAVLTDPSKTKEVTINASDIDTFGGFEDGKGVIETYAGKEYKADNAYVVYNGDLIDPGIYVSAVSEDRARYELVGLNGTATGQTMSYDQFIRPRVGKVRLVDNDNDSKYDVMFVDSYETVLITAATEKKITGKINNAAVTIDVDTSGLDKTVTVMKDGSEAKPKNLKKNEVVSLKRNLDNDVLAFEQVDNAITGKISSFESATMSEHAIAVINGQEYKIDINALSDAASGIEGTFVLDRFNRVGYIEKTSLIAASEKYGWVLSSYMSDSGEDYMVRLFSQEGTVKEYTFASKVDYWAPGAEDSVTYSASQMAKALGEAEYGIASVGQGVEIRLVKFSVNAKGEVTKLYVAKVLDDDAGENTYKKGDEYSTSAETYDKDSLVVGSRNMNGSISTGNMLGDRYYMTDGMLEITVPNSNEDMSDAGNYSVATVNAGAYLAKENGINRNCIFGEFSDDNQVYPTLVIRFEGAVDAAVSIGDYGTADNNPVMMVKKVLSGVDEDDNPIFTVVGYQNGGEVSYTTSANSALAKFNGFNDKEYNMINLWNAVDGMVEGSEEYYPGAQDISDILSTGDIVGIDNNGAVFLIFVDASEMIEQVKSGEITGYFNGSYTPGSVTRDNLHIGMVSDSDMGENAFMTVGTYKMAFDNGRAMDTAIVDEDGKITISSDTSTIGDVVDFDEVDKVGDFAFVRYANKGSLQEIFLFRFE